MPGLRLVLYLTFLRCGFISAFYIGDECKLSLSADYYINCFVIAILNGSKVDLCILECRYKGPYLLDAVDSFQPPVRDISRPLRMPICDVIKSHSLGQVAVSGKLDSGALRSGLKVYLVVITIKTNYVFVLDSCISRRTVCSIYWYY